MMQQNVYGTTTVNLQGISYTFCNRLDQNETLFHSFNALAQSTFGISFSEVGNGYEPHVLAIDGVVCANISVNLTPFSHNGQRRSYIQLGTVMTAPDFRGRGLSRWLMEFILDAWIGRCDALYLFANDSVLDFYPKFGFSVQNETAYAWARPTMATSTVQSIFSLLNPSDSHALLFEKYAIGNCFSAFYLMENTPIPTFYWDGIFCKNLYYLPQFDVIAIAEWEDDTLLCHEVLGSTSAPLSDILQCLCRPETKQAVLGFTPKDTFGFTSFSHHEEDTTLFLHTSGENLIAAHTLRFPVCAHA